MSLSAPTPLQGVQCLLDLGLAPPSLNDIFFGLAKTAFAPHHSSTVAHDLVECARFASIWPRNDAFNRRKLDVCDKRDWVASSCSL